MSQQNGTPALDGRRSGALVADAIDHRVLNALTESEQDDSPSNSENLLGSLACASQLPTGVVGVSSASFLGPHLRPCLGNLWIIGRSEVQRLLGTAEIATA